MTTSESLLLADYLLRREATRTAEEEQRNLIAAAVLVGEFRSAIEVAGVFFRHLTKHDPGIGAEIVEAQIMASAIGLAVALGRDAEAAAPTLTVVKGAVDELAASGMNLDWHAFAKFFGPVFSAGHSVSSMASPEKGEAE